MPLLASILSLLTDLLKLKYSPVPVWREIHPSITPPPSPPPPPHPARSLYVSGKLPTYPSPKPKVTLTSHLGQNVCVEEG